MTKEEEMKTENSGVYVLSNTRSYASMHGKKVVDTTTSKGIKQDHLGLTSDNFSHSIHTDVREDHEPVVVHVKPRDLYDMGEDNEEVEVSFSP
ncbi:hypothetical protein AHAS_Ahas13G0166400 [Arachis hypogaea]